MAIDLKNNSYIKYSAPYIEVEFVSVKGEKFQTTSLEFGGLILSIQIKKTINALPGTFIITMVGKNNFGEFFERNKLDASAYALFRPASLVTISINGKQKMIGEIDKISKNLSIDNKGRPIRNYTIVGRDLGKFLITHQIWYDDIVYKQREKQNTMMGAKSSFGMIGNEKSGEIMEKIINNWMIDVVNQNMTINDSVIEPFQYADNTKMQDRFIAMLQNKNSYSTFDTGTQITGPGCISSDTYADEYPINFAMSFMQGTLANFLQSFTSSPFNEFFVDTGDSFVNLNKDINGVMKRNKVYVIYRPTPFDDPNFDIKGPTSKLDMSNLFTYEIDDSIIQQKSLSMSNDHKFGAYYCSPQNNIIGFSADKAYAPATYDEISIRRYGYSIMNVKLGGFETSQKDSGAIESLVTSFQEKLKSWFERSDEYLSGSFVIKGNENIRIGSKLNYVRDEFGNIEDDYEEGYYYIAGITDDWAYGRNYYSILEVERGISKKIFKKENQNMISKNGQLSIGILRLG